MRGWYKRVGHFLEMWQGVDGIQSGPSSSLMVTGAMHVRVRGSHCSSCRTVQEQQISAMPLRDF